MIEITDLEHLINDNKKMINMFDTFKNKIISQNEILLFSKDYPKKKLKTMSISQGRRSGLLTSSLASINSFMPCLK